MDVVCLISDCFPVNPDVLIVALMRCYVIFEYYEVAHRQYKCIDPADGGGGSLLQISIQAINQEILKHIVGLQSNLEFLKESLGENTTPVRHFGSINNDSVNSSLTDSSDNPSDILTRECAFLKQCSQFATGFLKQFREAFLKQSIPKGHPGGIPEDFGKMAIVNSDTTAIIEPNERRPARLNVG
ncbi:hypothetical protein RP20_CCG002577 [Aedes albopictus]|nr:hypothetical protein RP20_CCG002577 [Aedes albopictus]